MRLRSLALVLLLAPACGDPGQFEVAGWVNSAQAVPDTPLHVYLFTTADFASPPLTCSKALRDSSTSPPVAYPVEYRFEGIGPGEYVAVALQMNPSSPGRALLGTLAFQITTTGSLQDLSAMPLSAVNVTISGGGEVNCAP